MDALPFMENIVHNRPDKFNSIQKGIEYMYKSEYRDFYFRQRA